MSRILRNVTGYRSVYLKGMMRIPTPTPTPQSPSFHHHHHRGYINPYSFRFYLTPSYPPPPPRDPLSDAVQTPPADAGDNFATEFISLLSQAATYLGDGTNKLWAIGVFVTLFYNSLKHFKKPDGRVIVLNDNHLQILFKISKNVYHDEMVCHIRDHSDVELVCPFSRFWRPSVCVYTMPLPAGNYTGSTAIAGFNAKTRLVTIDVYNGRWSTEEKESPKEEKKLVAPKAQLLLDF